MNVSTRCLSLIVAVFLSVTCCFAISAQAQAKSKSPAKLGFKIHSAPMQRHMVTIDQSILISTASAIRQISLAAPEIADSVLLSPQQVYVIGKTIGTTNLTLWDSRNNVSVLDIEVTPDIVGLKAKLQEIMPSEPIGVTAAREGLTLFGDISSAARLSQALALAELFAPNKVTNLMQVSGIHQVMLEVRVAEMSSTLTKRLGINFGAFADGNFFGVSTLNGLTSFGLSETLDRNVFTISDSINAILGFEAGDVSVTGFLDALKEDGLTKILAEPTLIALSGQEASFLAGGEFPVPVPQGDGDVTIEFRSFGVALRFTPTVLSPDKISIRVAPEVSELDFANAVTLAGTRVPGLVLRRASTVIELGDGQSFAIAGLLREQVREVVSKFPILGEIPILGALFRSSSFERGETELIIIVTPRLVKPLDVAKQPLPIDAYVEPTDVEFFLFGKLQGQSPKEGRQGKLDGTFGYITTDSGASR